MLVQPLATFVDVRKEQAERNGTKKGLPIVPMLRGLIIALTFECFSRRLAFISLLNLAGGQGFADNAEQSERVQGQHKCNPREGVHAR